MSATELDAFWSPLIEVTCAQMIASHFWSSIGEMTRDVDLVVVGRPVAVHVRGEGGPMWQVTVMDIEIDEVISGEPVTRDDGLIELEMYYGPPPIASLGLPVNRHLFFLRNVAAANEAGDWPVTETDWYSYKPPSLYQNILVEADGEVLVPAVESIRGAADEYGFPAGLHGTSFEAVLTAARDAAARTAHQNDVMGSMRFAC
jgi:hypothetical protein